MRPALDGGRLAAALTVAGSDSGGNAGVQADVRAFHAFGVHACTALAALTAQNPSGVFGVEPVPPEFVALQIRTVLPAYAPAAAKTGMLASEGVVRAVAACFREAGSAAPALVVDPVMVATSGARLADGGAALAMRDDLLPLAALATPNVPEAEVLSGLGRIASKADMEAAARAIAARAGCAVLVKGGHRAGAEADDFLLDPASGSAWWLSAPVVPSPLSTHGTGCSLSAAAAAALARGAGLLEAVTAAKAWVYGAIRSSVSVGPGAAVLGFADPARFLPDVTVRRA